MLFDAFTNGTMAIDANVGVTYDSSNRVSAIADQLSLIANFAQTTDANKILISRTDNKGNLLRRSHDVVNWTNYAGVTVSGKTVTASAGTGARGVSNSTTSFRSNLATTGQTFRQIIEVEYVNYQWAWIGNGSDSVWRGVRVDLLNGLIDLETNLISSSIETISSGRYKITLLMTQATISNHSLYVSFGTSSTINGSTSITVAGTEQIKVHYGVSQHADWDTDIIETTTYPQFAGVNGNSSFVLHGAQWASTTDTIDKAVNSTDGLLYAVVKPFLIGSEHQIIRNANAGQYALRTKSANAYYFIDSDGTPRYAETPASASINQLAILRARKVGGYIYIAINTGSGFSEGTGVACGASSTLTGVFSIGASAGTALYGHIVGLYASDNATIETTAELDLQEKVFRKIVDAKHLYEEVPTKIRSIFEILAKKEFDLEKIPSSAVKWDSASSVFKRYDNYSAFVEMFNYLNHQRAIQSYYYYALTTGSSNAYLASIPTAPSSYYTGMRLLLKLNFTNTGSSTINVNSLGVKTIKHRNGATLIGGEMNNIVELTYDGTDFILTKFEPAWTTWTPSFGASAGSFTAGTVHASCFKHYGDNYDFKLYVSGGTCTSNADYLTATLPKASANMSAGQVFKAGIIGDTAGAPQYDLAWAFVQNNSTTMRIYDSNRNALNWVIPGTKEFYIDGNVKC